MSIEDNKTLVRQFLDEIFGKRNLAVIDELFEPAFVNHDTLPGFSQDTEGFAEGMAAFLEKREHRFKGK